MRIKMKSKRYIRGVNIINKYPRNSISKNTSNIWYCRRCEVTIEINLARYAFQQITNIQMYVELRKYILRFVNIIIFTCI